MVPDSAAELGGQFRRLRVIWRRSWPFGPLYFAGAAWRMNDEGLKQPATDDDVAITCHYDVSVDRRVAANGGYHSVWVWCGMHSASVTG